MVGAFFCPDSAQNGGGGLGLLREERGKKWQKVVKKGGKWCKVGN